MSDYKELVRRLRREVPVNGQVAADAIEKLSAEVERLESYRSGGVAEAIRDIHKAVERQRDEALAELARWRDPESDERQKLQEEIIFSLGDGARSEVELREGQLDATEAALALARAEVERLSNENNALTAERDQALMLAEGPTTLLDMAAGFAARGLACANWEAEVERLKGDREAARSLNAYIADRINEEVRQAGSHPQVQNWTSMDEFRAALRGLGDRLLHTRQERDEALAARETYAMTARQDIIEKAKALDELEAWLRSGADWRSADLQAAGADAFGVQLDEGGCVEACEDAPTLAAAIRAALEKASGQGGK